MYLAACSSFPSAYRADILGSITVPRAVISVITSLIIRSAYS